jgi:DNA modification methylase
VNIIVILDNIDGTKILPENSFDLIVTSPPYAPSRQTRGVSWYHATFQKIAEELRRLLGSVPTD